MSGREMMRVAVADFSDSRVTDMLRLHAAVAQAETARGSAHALDLDGLRRSDIALWATWQGDTLCGVGALRRLSAEQGEVKSMFTAPTQRRQGAGSAMLRHIICVARQQGMLTLSLETGAWPYFHPAQRFYERHGFVACPPFGEYVLDPNSVFMSLRL